jgi:hypothetical protein
LQFVSGTGTGRSFDGFNLTGSATRQNFDIEFLMRTGLSKITVTETDSFTLSADGQGSYSNPGRNADDSFNRQRGVVENIYDRDANDHLITGIMTNTVGFATFDSDDGHGNKTSGTTDTLYRQDIINQTGQAKVSQTVTKSKTVNRDGSSANQSVTVTYGYDAATTKLNGATGSGTGGTNDGFENTTTSVITQTYVIKAGQARLEKTVTTTTGINRDDSTNPTRPSRVMRAHPLAANSSRSASTCFTTSNAALRKAH